MVKAHRLVRTVAPANLVSLSEMKAHLRVDFADDDDLIASYLAAAMAMVDGPNGVIGKALVAQSWSLTCSPLYGLVQLNLPLTPVIAVASIDYFDETNELQAWDVGNTSLWGDEDSCCLALAEGVRWPAMCDRPDALTITFSSGFGEPSAVPANVSQAVKLLVAHWYESREDVASGARSTVPHGFDHLVSLSRMGWFA